jgi:NAD(P)-dependent dehydrogenase (short-subunit alcohol dehydrogenase family)
MVAIGAMLGIGWFVRSMLSQHTGADLSNQNVLITGGTRGLGYLLAKEFAKHGCRIAVCGRDGEEVEFVQRELSAQGIEIFAKTCDVGDNAQVETLIQEVTQQLGSIDILVNNAGVIQVGPVQKMTPQDFHDMMNSSFFGEIHCTLAVLPQMLERKSGRIVNITSIGGKVSVPHLLPYSAAKFACVGFSEGLRAELANTGITVTTIIPGLMRTGSYLQALFKGRQAEEFVWFSLGDNAPIISMDAVRAAKQIVTATRHGEAERILTMPAIMLDMVHRMFPRLTLRILSLVNRFLPSPQGGTTTLSKGIDIQQRIHSPKLDELLKQGQQAAEANNELVST